MLESVSGYYYPLNINYSNPIREFIKEAEDENMAVVAEAITEWLKPTISYEAGKDNKILMQELFFVAKMGLNYDFKDNKLRISGYDLIIYKIIDFFLKKLPNNSIDIDVVKKILNGGMGHTYYITGEYGNKIFDYLEEDIKNGGGTFTHIRNQLVPFFTEEVDKNKSIPHLESFLRKSKRGEIEKLDQKELKSLLKLSANNEQRLKFNKEGIELVKYQFENDKDIIKGFRQIRIKRKTSFDINLLVSMISAIYFDTELFIYFDPYFFNLGIADKENLNFEKLNPYIVLNFSKMIHSYFCDHVIEARYKKEKLKFKKSNSKEIKQMFDNVLKEISNLSVDDVSLCVDCKIEDKMKFKDVNQKITNGEIGYIKHRGEKKKIKVSIKDNLQSYKKRINKKK